MILTLQLLLLLLPLLNIHIGKLEFDFSTMERPDYDNAHPEDLEPLGNL